MIKKLRINEIRIDGGTQPRCEINNSLVAEYAEEIKLKKPFPPLDVFHDGKHYWLVDGFHRRHGYVRAGVMQVDCQITEGTLEEARWASLAKNHAHGLRRTNEDKREAVKKALEMKPELSDHALAEHCGVVHQTVANTRSELAKLATSPIGHTGEVGKRIGKDGKKYPAPPLPPPPTEDDELFEKAREWYNNTPEYENMAGGKALIRNISGLQKALDLSREKATELFDRICDGKFADAKPKKTTNDTMEVERTLKKIIADPCAQGGCCYCESKCAERLVEFGRANSCKEEMACSKDCPRLIKGGKKSEIPAKPLDAIGREIPSEAMETWSRKGEAADILRHLSAIRGYLRDAMAKPDPFYAEIHVNNLMANVDNLYANMNCLVPYTVCPNCQGLTGCRLCGNRKMISKFKWDTVLSETQRQRALQQVKK